MARVKCGEMTKKRRYSFNCRQHSLTISTYRLFVYVSHIQTLCTIYIYIYIYINIYIHFKQQQQQPPPRQTDVSPVFLFLYHSFSELYKCKLYNFYHQHFAVQNAVGPADSNLCVPIGCSERNRSHICSIAVIRGGVLIVVHVQGDIGLVVESKGGVGMLIQVIGTVIAKEMKSTTVLKQQLIGLLFALTNPLLWVPCETDY